MDFVVNGLIRQALPISSGVSKTGNQWMSASYLVEHEGGQYPKSILVDVKGENIQKFNLQVGEYATLHLRINTREHNGKFFNTVEAWSCEKQGQHQQAPQPQYQTYYQGAQQPQPQPQPAPMPNGNQPF